MNTLTPEEKNNGWILLFDGKTINGWRNYNRQELPAIGWIVEDGLLKCLGLGSNGDNPEGGDIIYNKRFENFHLKIDWKISTGGNSGIFYMAQEIPGEQIWNSALEMQLLDNENHPDAKKGIRGNRLAGSLYDLIPADPQNTKPAGEWNAVEIIVNGNKVAHYMNGAKILNFEMYTPEWDSLVAGSKFKDFNKFGKVKTGFIGLQDHYDLVWFRNIKLKEF